MPSGRWGLSTPPPRCFGPISSTPSRYKNLRAAALRTARGRADPVADGVRGPSGLGPAEWRQEVRLHPQGVKGPCNRGALPEATQAVASLPTLTSANITPGAPQRLDVAREGGVSPKAVPDHRGGNNAGARAERVVEHPRAALPDAPTAHRLSVLKVSGATTTCVVFFVVRGSPGRRGRRSAGREVAASMAAASIPLPCGGVGGHRHGVAGLDEVRGDLVGALTSARTTP